jgi:glucose-1-phosphate cytidylyltransferase
MMGGWIDGVFLLSPKVGDLIAEDSTIWEREP